MTGSTSANEIRTAAPYFPDVDRILEDIGRVLKSGWLMEGPFGALFELEVCQRWDVGEAVAVNSCTSALQIALQYLEVSGKEVLLSTNTYIATGNAVLYAGGMPVFADIAPHSLCAGPRELERHLSATTAGVIHTHIAGIIDPQFEAVVEFCHRRGLFLIEDCAHAHGARAGARFVGTCGDVGCFSFYPTKILTSGTGGLLTTRHSRLAEYARSVRVHGRSTRPYVFDKPGNDWFMNEVTAVLALHQLRWVETFVEHRRAIAGMYRNQLDMLPQISFFQEGDGRSVYYKLPVTVESPLLLQNLAASLRDKLSVECEPLYYPPCHMQPVFVDRPGLRLQPCPVAEDVLSRQFCLPLHAQFTEGQVRQVSRALMEFFGDHRSRRNRLRHIHEKQEPHVRGHQ